METPITPKRPRPGLNARSYTASGAFTSPPKDGQQPKDSPQEPKRHHLDLFHHHHNHSGSNHHHRHHHSPASSRHSKDKSSTAGRVRDLKNHVPNPVAEFSHAVSSGANHVRNVKDELSAMSSRRESRDIPSDLALASRVPSQAVTPEDVELARNKRQQQEQALRHAFDSLSDTAQSSARRFDFIYYGLLEKVTRLHALIASLQELSRGSTKLRDDFERETSALVADASRQIDAFDEFRQQQGAVRALERRIAEGRKRAERLAGRLEDARRNAEMWRQGEDEWQARTTKRLTIMQFVLLAVVVLVAGLLWFRRHVDVYSAREASARGFDELINSSSVPQFIVDDLTELRSSRLAAQVGSSTDTSLPQEETLMPDRRLRGFDEL